MKSGGGILFFVWLLIELGPNPTYWLKFIVAIISWVVLFYLISVVLATPIWINDWFRRTETGRRWYGIY